jgi:hypothetical protein
MSFLRHCFPGLWLTALVGLTGSAVGAAPVIICRGMCDASAIVLAGNDHFIVADDEDNILRVYSRTMGGAPAQTLDLSSFLRVDPKSPETDLEGAAVLDGRVYWITSHARNKNGKERPSRYRFFATTVIVTNGTIELKPTGNVSTRLLADLLNEPRLKAFDLTAAAQRAPKTKDAFNIEGLCATPEGGLLLGFRNPNPGGKALLVPLLNPAELLDGKAARFGAPLLLDLGGHGIRSLTRSGARYFMIAGSYDGKGTSSLYEWGGGALAPKLLPHPELKGLNPEALECLTENGRERLLVVSDDGTLKIGGTDCKEVQDPNLRYFRATVIDL